METAMYIVLAIAVGGFLPALAIIGSQMKDPPPRAVSTREAPKASPSDGSIAILLVMIFGLAGLVWLVVASPIVGLLAIIAGLLLVVAVKR